jgi:hypothetical protein
VYPACSGLLVGLVVGDGRASLAGGGFYKIAATHTGVLASPLVRPDMQTRDPWVVGVFSSTVRMSGHGAFL